MSDKVSAVATIGTHGAERLTAVEIDSYNIELKDDEDGESFLGDRASKRAFEAILDNLRMLQKKLGEDPFGKRPTADLTKGELADILADDDIAAAAIVHGAIEEYAAQLAHVIRRLLKSKAWAKTEVIAIGGGFRQGRIGELAIARTAMLLASDEVDIALQPIRNHPDDAGLIGAIHLAPSWIFEASDAILAIDIGGTNIRCGIVETRLKKAADLSKAAVVKSELWNHAEDSPTRDQVIKRIATTLRALIKHAASEKLTLAPFIGVSCPGVIEQDGSIDRGTQNLPGNWGSRTFNLAQRLIDEIPSIEGHDTAVLLHNDAVVQGLSEVPFMRDVKRWGILTIGTGLGNARFTNRTDKS